MPRGGRDAAPRKALGGEDMPAVTDDSSVSFKVYIMYLIRRSRNYGVYRAIAAAGGDGPAHRGTTLGPVSDPRPKPKPHRRGPAGAPRARLAAAPVWCKRGIVPACACAVLLSAMGCQRDRGRRARGTVDAAPPAAKVKPAAPRLPFDPDDDRLDVVGAWAMAAPSNESDAPPAARARRLPIDHQPWPLPVNGSLRIELWQRLADFRVRLLDDRGRILPHEALVGQVPGRTRGDRVEPGGTWVEVHPTEGFPPGRPVRVVIDGENGPRPLDIHGKGYEDLTLDAVGDTPPKRDELQGDAGSGIGVERIP